MTTTTDEDSRPTHPRTVNAYAKADGSPGTAYRLVLSPRAMRAIAAAKMADEDIATDCHRRVRHSETRSELFRTIGTLALAGPHAAGWGDYADAVAATTVEKP